MTDVNEIAEHIARALTEGLVVQVSYDNPDFGDRAQVRINTVLRAKGAGGSGLVDGDVFIEDTVPSLNHSTKRMDFAMHPNGDDVEFMGNGREDAGMMRTFNIGGHSTVEKIRAVLTMHRNSVSELINRLVMHAQDMTAEAHRNA